MIRSVPGYPVEQFARMRAAHDLEREQAVDAPLDQIGQDGPHVAVAVGVPEIDAVGVELTADALVARGHTSRKKSTETIGPFLKQISSHPEA